MTLAPDADDHNDLAARKAAARKVASAVRKQAKQNAGAEASVQVAETFVQRIVPPPGSGVSGFLPIGSEIDVRSALQRLREQGCAICLPCVVAPSAPLVFRLWTEGDPLVEEPFGTRAPAPDAPAVQPDVLMVPMLAFDAAGFRLGYGGGFYDRSLEKLRREKPVLAVGVAYEGQRVKSVPKGRLDQPLDWIVTERGAFRPTADGGAS